MGAPNYGMHEAVYLRNRASGRVGWFPREDDYAPLFARLGRWMPAPGGRLLELGCGAGDQSLWFAAQGWEVVGIDVSPTAVAWAQEKAAARGLSARFLAGSVLDLPFADGTFDRVFDGLCWHCIVGEDRTRFLCEARRVLRPGGAFTGCTMVDGCKSPTLPGYDPQTRLHTIDGVPVRYWATGDELLSDLARASLTVERHEVERRAGEDEDVMLVDARKA